MNKSPVSIGAGFCANRLTLVALVALLSLTACGGGGGGSAANDPAQPQDVDPCDHGIEGGGRHIFSGLVTAADAGGRVTVSSVQFGTTGAKVLTDGTPANASSLRRGDVVTLTGDVDLAARSGCADAVFADATIVGTVDAVDTGLRTLVVLGQTVSVGAATVFGEDLQAWGLSSLQTGDRIRVSGLWMRTMMLATRIDRDMGADGYSVAGPLSGLDTVNREFRINAIRVRYDAASLEGFPDGGPRADDNVRLSGTVVVTDPESATGVIVLRPARVEFIAYDVPLEISPAHAFMHTGDMIQFLVSRGTGSVTWSISDSRGITCTPAACGVIDSTGKYQAPAMPTSPQGLLITATSITDPRESATAIVVVPQFALSKRPGPHTISGDIFSAETGPVEGDTPVNLWVDQGSFGYSWWWANGPLIAHDGLFRAPNVPDSQFSIWVYKSGYYQPCVVTGDVHGDVTVRIELQPESVFAVPNAPRPSMSAEPSLSGMVYETTDAGRQPVAGAELWLTGYLDEPYATTLSDAGGGYYLCNLDNLPPPGYVSVGKPGYASIQIGPIPIANGALQDIELKRL